MTSDWSCHEVLCNILVEFGLFIKLLRLIKNLFKRNCSERPDWQTLFPAHFLFTLPNRCFMPLVCNFAFECARRNVQVKKDRVVVKLDLSHIQGRTCRGYQEWGAEEDIWTDRI